LFWPIITLESAIFLKLDRKAEAIEEFEEVVKTSPSGEIQNAAKRYLELLK